MIYRLFEEPLFPDPEEADADGLLAIGGDLSPIRLLNAYSCGIFPWYNERSPILWWSTDPRLVLFPSELHVPASLAKTLRRGRFTFTFDRDFAGVIRACAATPRPGQGGTWLVPEMIEAYIELHRLGFAHSCEAWEGAAGEGDLAGGVYGVALGSAFFGESMFYRVPEASKAALVTLVRALEGWGYRMMDCQQSTAHMRRFGAREVTRRDFLARLAACLRDPDLSGCWPVGRPAT